LKILLYDVLLGLIYRFKKKIKIKKTSSKLRNNYFLIANSYSAWNFEQKWVGVGLLTLFLKKEGKKVEETRFNGTLIIFYFI